MSKQPPFHSRLQGGGGGGGGKPPPKGGHPRHPFHSRLVGGTKKPKKPSKPSKPKTPKHPFHSRLTKPGGGGKKRGTGDVACCVAEALAASLRWQGWPVSDTDVLALYRLTAGGPDEGASIEATLGAAAIHGLAGMYPESFAEVAPGEAGLILGVDVPGPHTVFDDGELWWSWGWPHIPFSGAAVEEAWKVDWAYT